MKYLLRTTAIAVAMGAMSIGALAQGSDASAKDEQAAVGGLSCDAFFVYVDTDNDRMVSRQEATRAIEQDFEAIDTNDDGEISQAEYVDCKARIGEGIAQADRTADTMAEADSDQNQSIDRDEYMRAAQQAYEGSGDASGSEDPSIITLSRYLWFTPEELQAGNFRDMSADEAGTRAAMSFAALDANQDGIVDTREWEQKVPGGDKAGGWATARFQRIDQDSTGSISKEEFAAARSGSVDETQTGSVSDAADSGTSTDTASGNAAADTGEGAQQNEGIPVFIYRFMTF